MLNLFFNGVTPLTTLFWVINPGSSGNSGTTADIPNTSGTPPFNTGGGATAQYNPDNQIITWNPPSSGTVPAFLQGLTFKQLIALLGTNIIVDRNITLTATNGNQSSIASSEPRIFMELFANNAGFSSGDLLNQEFRVNCCNPGSYQYVYNGVAIPLVLPVSENTSISVDSIKAYPWNNGGTNQSAYSVNITAQMSVTFTIICTSTPGALNTSNLETGFCLNFCRDNISNMNVCFPQFNNYCFTETGGTPVIFENGGSNGCNTFFTTYLGSQGPGPNAALDTNLNKACGNIDTLDEFNAESQNIQTICACHINQEFYNNLLTSIRQLPGGSLIDLPAQCLFPPCVNSVYKPDLTGKVCPSIPCVQITEINNNGDIGGGATINQSCITSGGGGGGGGGGSGGGTSTTPKSFWDRNWPWIVGLIGFLLVFLIVIIIIIVSDNSSKKPPYPRV